MDVVSTRESAKNLECDAHVILVFESPEDGGEPAKQFNAEFGGLLQRYITSELVSAKAGKTSLVPSPDGLKSTRVLFVGGGKQEDFGQGEAYRAGAAAAKALATSPRSNIVFNFGELPAAVAAAAVAGGINGGVGQDIFREKKNLQPSEKQTWCHFSDQAIQTGKIVGEALLTTRELVNLPANYIYPETFAREAASVALSAGLEFEVWDEMRLRRENCNAMLGVSAGSGRPPRLVILRHAGTKKQPPLVLAGKGVTFDSGGLSLKPSDGMLKMKCDMAGAASVVGAMQAIANLQLDAPVVGIVGLVENMISGDSFKLGDVITTRSGKTVEIHNTDAEGRLVLADVLNVALDEKPSAIIDLATLTGACLVALGTDIAGLMSNNETLQSNLQQAATVTGEDVWPLPMHAHFREQIQSKVADIKNLGEGRWGGAITAAKFLEEFVDDTPWIHIDIAGPAFYDSPKPFLDAGASGAIVRTLIQFASAL